MPDFSFRIRFLVSRQNRLPMKAATWTFSFPDAWQLMWLVPRDPGFPIGDSPELIVVSSGWPTAESAQAAGERCKQALTLVFTRLGIGADFGPRTPTSVFTSYGLQWAGQMFGGRTINNVHGLMVYETDPPPMFAGMNLKAHVTRAPGRFEKVLGNVLAHASEMTPRQQLAHDLFHASFFETSGAARFLALVMAVEAMLEPQPRPEGSRRHVERLLALTDDAEGLDEKERDSIGGALKWLFSESIGQAGRRLARERLGDRKYLGKPAAKFFTDCYGLRSRLVHGSTGTPTSEDIANVVTEFQTLVSDLLAGPLLDL